MESRQWGQFMSVRMSEAQAKALLGKHYAPAKPRAKAQKTPKAPSQGEQLMAAHLRAENIAFVTEFKFCDSRRWRSDFHLTGTKILIEVEGGTWSGGRHTRGKGYEQDCEKYNWAAANGWTVLRYTTGQVKSGLALQGVLMAIGAVNA